jgi:hypothetical protein
LADLRLLWIVALALGVILIRVFLARPLDVRARTECTRRYSAAISAADTTAIDDVRPNEVNPKFSGDKISCGELRRLGRLR